MRQILQTSYLQSLSQPIPLTFRNVNSSDPVGRRRERLLLLVDSCMGSIPIQDLGSVSSVVER
jgi:hypothetical protein